MKISGLLSVIAAALVATAALAQPATKPPATPTEPPSGKIGYVNSERVMHEARMTRLAKQALEDKYRKLTEEAQAGPQELVERRILALDEDFRRENEDALRQYVDRTNRIIRRIALAENLDIVFLEAAYFSPHIDYTDRVIKELDAEP